MPGEFELIERWFAAAAEMDETISLGIGDDCALVHLTQSTELALSIDTLVEGVHFLPEIEPEDLAWRLLGSAVSDLAAMGAEPLWLTLALTLPKENTGWLEPFSQALAQACRTYGIKLIGGDTTSGPVRVLSAQVHGRVESGRALKRSGAQVGDLICVSGTLGDSRAGLALLLGERECAPGSVKADLLARYHRPTPRLSLARALLGKANAAIDISDGLLADLEHILSASGVGAELEVDRLPLSESLMALLDLDQALSWALSGGEDFELCFTLPAHQLEALRAEADLPVTAVGRITESPGLQLRRSGQPYQTPDSLGFDHFGV